MAVEDEAFRQFVRDAIHDALEESWRSEFREVARAAVHDALRTGMRDTLRWSISVAEGKEQDKSSVKPSRLAGYKKSKSMGVLGKKAISYNRSRSLGLYRGCSQESLRDLAGPQGRPPRDPALLKQELIRNRSHESLTSLVTAIHPPSTAAVSTATAARPEEPIETVERLAEKQVAGLLGVDSRLPVRWSDGRTASKSPRTHSKSPNLTIQPSNASPRSDFDAQESKQGSYTPASNFLEVLPGFVTSERHISDEGSTRAQPTSRQPLSRQHTTLSRQHTTLSMQSIGEHDIHDEDALAAPTRTIDMVTIRNGQEKAITTAFIKSFFQSKPGEDVIGSTSDHSILSLPRGLRVALYVYGVVPSESHWLWCFRRACIFLATLIYGGWLALDLAHAHVSTQDVLCGLGAAVSLLTLRWDGIHFLLSNCRSPLEAYASCRSFLEVWRLHSARMSLAVLLLWLVDGALRIVVCVYLQDVSWWNIAISWFASSLFASLVCFQLHICEALAIMVDDFCTQFFAMPDFSRGIREWNTIQAVLRQAGKSIDSCCLVLSTFALTAAVLDGAAVLFTPPDGGLARRLLFQLGPSVLKVSLALFGLHRAAAVSEKCTQAPALINSLSMPDDVYQMDHERQYLVRYMEASGAGFYIKGVRINGLMVMKVSYVLASILVVLVMRANAG